MTAWVVAVPVWGDEFVAKFTKYVFPAIKVALQQLPPEDTVRFIIHTDQPSKLSPLLLPNTCPENWMGVEFHGIPGGANSHEKLGEINRHSLRLAAVGEAVALINGDMIPSIEVFTAARKRFEEGKRLILCMGTRVLEDSGFCVPPIGEKSRALLKWAWEHRHPWITGCIWGTGNSRSPTVLYFPLSDGVVLHAFHLHPFALLKEDPGLTFHGVTIDRDLQDAFTNEHTHVVTDADELSFAELSPAGKDMGTGNVIDRTYVASFAKNVATRAHRWVFGHRIEIVGPANDLSDVQVAAMILHDIEIYIPPDNPSAPRVDVSQLQYLSKERREILMKQETTARALARRFFIALPAWGDRYVEMTTKYVIPAIAAARLRARDTTVHVHIYTDQKERMQAALAASGLNGDCRRVNLEIGPHKMMTIAHQQVITETPVGATIVLLNGDIVPSCELFDYALSVFPNKRVIATSGLRTVIAKEEPPIGVTGRELLGWGWRNRHPIAEACVWSRSHTSFPNVLFFERNGSVVMHTFHLHPFVMLKDRNPHYKGTVDDDLLSNYEKHEIQYVSNAELSFVEISGGAYGPSYYDKRNERLTVEGVAKFAKIMLPAHWRNFHQQIRVIGSDSVDSMTVIEAIEKMVRPSIHHPWPQAAQDRMAR